MSFDHATEAGGAYSGRRFAAESSLRHEFPSENFAITRCWLRYCPRFGIKWNA